MTVICRFIALIYQVWQNNSAGKVAGIVIQNEELWESDLTKLPRLLAAVQEYLNEYLASGVLSIIARIESKKEAV